MKVTLNKEINYKELLSNHHTIASFSRLINVARKSIYEAINDGRIKPDLVGFEKTMMIDASKYKDTYFDSKRGARTKYTDNKRTPNHTTNAKKQRSSQSKTTAATG